MSLPRFCGKPARSLGDRATAQLFSVPDKTGIEEARKLLESWLDDRVFPARPERRIVGGHKKPR